MHCEICGGAGVVFNRQADKLDAGPHGSSPLYYEDVEVDCHACEDSRRIERLEVHVDELISELRVLTQALVSRLDLDLQNIPRVVSDDDIPF